MLLLPAPTREVNLETRRPACVMCSGVSAGDQRLGAGCGKLARHSTLPAPPLPKPQRGVSYRSRGQLKRRHSLTRSHHSLPFRDPPSTSTPSTRDMEQRKEELKVDIVGIPVLDHNVETCQPEEKPGLLPKPAFVTQMQKHKVRALKTMCLYLAYTALGMASGMSGPTILDLQLTVGTTFDQITYVIPGRSVGYAMGSLIVGFSFAYLNVQALIAITCGLSAVFLGILPFNRTLWGLILTFFANGIVNGMLDTGSNLMTLVLWGKENGPFMQALHFSYGLGAFHAPLLAKPFLLELLEPVGNRTSDDNSTLDYQDYVFPEYTVDDVALEIPYGVMAVFMVINSVIFSYLFLKFRETKPHPSRLVSDAMEKLGGAFKMNRRVRYTIIVTATLFMHIYCGLELMFGTLITSYAVKCDLKLDKATGAVMASVYWAFFTFFRLFAIFFADIIGAENNIYFNFSLIALANFFLIPFGNNNVYCLWAGIILMGLGTSSIWASIFGFLEDFFPVTSGITASFSVAACLGQSIMPFIVGYFIDSYPPIFLWVMLACTFMLIALFSFFSYLCKHCLRKKTLS